MRSSRLAIAGSLALLVAACAHRPRGPDGQPLWVEAEFEHFVLRGDISDEDARASLLQLERVRLGLLTVSWHASKQPPKKTHVILLYDEDELDEYVRRGVLGFAATDVFDAPLLVSSADHRLEEVPVLAHEMAHHVDNAFLLRQPRWLSEGLASYLETIHIAADGSSARVGDANRDRLAYIRHFPRLDLRRVMAIGPELYSLPRPEVEAFYAQSWLLVHFLANQRRAQLDDWINRLAKADDPDASWEKAFGKLSAAQLENEVRDYLAHGKFSMLEMPLPALHVESSVRPLPAAEVKAEQALLRMISPGQSSAQTAARAAVEAEQALKADPQSPLAAGVWFATGRRSRDEKIAVARAVTAAHPLDARGFELLGMALGGAGGAEEVEALETAVRLAPDDARALSHLSFSYLARRREKDALPVAYRAVQLAPGNPFSLDAFAVALAATGHCAEAPGIERRALDMLPDGAAAEAAQHLRQRLTEFDQICSAQEQGTYAGYVPAEPGTTPAHPTGACKQAGPRIRLHGLKAGTVISVDFIIAPDGKPAGIKVKGNVPAAVVKAVSDYLATCPFAAARGPSGPVEWPMSMNFTFRPEEK